MQIKPCHLVGRLGVLLLLCAGAALAQTDWPMYGHDPGSSRYSPLTQIDIKNVSKLQRVWTFHMKADVPPPPPARAGRGPFQRRSETTPLMVNNVLYLPTPFNRVVALNAETGAKIWEFVVPGGASASNRGVAYWPGDQTTPPRIIFGTSDAHLLALSAETGELITQFGDGGSVDMKPGVTNNFPNPRVTMSSPAMIYKNVIVTGSSVQETPSLGAAGDIRGWDAYSGKLLWTFHTVPHEGEAGNETWQTPGSTQQRSGADSWGLSSVDPETGLIFLPTGNPTSNFYGADRKGNDLYANCVVALDIQTGKLKWYFQAIHHDIWDYDLAGAPLLVTVNRHGKKIPAVVFTSKAGWVFILNRNDGTPIYGVEERPVPQGDSPGEQQAATEPFPLKPPPLGRTDFKASDVAAVTPEQQKFCENLIQSNGGLQNSGPFTPFGTKMTVVFPGSLGAMNWYGGSYDPKLGYVFYNIENQADWGQVIPAPEGSPMPYVKTAPSGGSYARFWNPDNDWPCQAPPWGQLVALNVNTGEYAWRVPLGTYPELDAKGIHDTGSMNMGGSIATAGGLVFISATTDHHFRAFEEKTGKIVWDTQLESGAYDTPMTYQAKNGKQYIVIVATGGGYYDKTSGDSVIAFALP